MNAFFCQNPLKIFLYLIFKQSVYGLCFFFCAKDGKHVGRFLFFVGHGNLLHNLLIKCFFHILIGIDRLDTQKSIFFIPIEVKIYTAEEMILFMYNLLSIMDVFLYNQNAVTQKYKSLKVLCLQDFQAS